MTKSCLFLLSSLLVMGCQSTPLTTQPPASVSEPCHSEPSVTEPAERRPSKTEEWVAFTRSVEALDSDEFPARRQEAERRYEFRPDDANRMRLSYLLSRPDPSMQQLSQSREILAQISNASELAPFRDLLDREIASLMQLKRNQGRILELEAQLQALKAIEEEMIESREALDEEQP